MMEATALWAVLIIPSQVKKSNKCLWIPSCAGAVLVPASVKHSPFSPWGNQEGELVDVLVAQGVISHAGT